MSSPRRGTKFKPKNNTKENGYEESNCDHGSIEWFGALSARVLAKAGHIAYASTRDTARRNAPQVEPAAKFAKENKVDLRTIELDVASQSSADAATQKIVSDDGRLDVVIHNAGHMVFGPAEAFTPEQLAELYDVNVLSTQRVNRAALPQLCKQRRDLVVWVSSSSCAGGTPPYLAPYFAAKAGMDGMAVVYARELTRWGIETSIIVPGAFTGGTNHFAHAGSPADKARVAKHEAGPYKGFADDVLKGFSSIVPPHANVEALRTPSSRWSMLPLASDRSVQALRSNARRSGGGQYGFGSRPCRASSSNRPHRRADTSGLHWPIEKRRLAHS
jgi:NAD(P)-dependent dehydrogenase (short-subunit alcohol dehydrogenase family)